MNIQFHYLMDLHYSQTNSSAVHICIGFTTLWIYTILKLECVVVWRDNRFTTIWIYTILKL